MNISYIFWNNEDLQSRFNADIRDECVKFTVKKGKTVQKHLTKMMLMNDMRIRKEAIINSNSYGGDTQEIIIDRTYVQDEVQDLQSAVQGSVKARL